MGKFEISPPSGFPEFTPAQNRVRAHWERTISSIFEKYGFDPIETPIVERTQNLLGKGGNAKEMYVLERLHEESADTEKEKSRALRFDHTVPLALFVARHLNEISFPFRRFAVGPVFRGERAQRGRFRQFSQADIDVIGSENLPLEHDAEMVAIAIEIFEKLLPNCEFCVRINNRKLFAALSEDGEKQAKILKILDDLEKVGEKKVRGNFENSGFANSEIDQIFQFLQVGKSEKSPEKVLENLGKISRLEKFQTGVSELLALFSALEKMRVPQNRFRLDLSIARGLDYYSGSVFETQLIGFESFGSICSGGRYEDLAKIFTGRSLPGVGISIGLTRVLALLFEASILDEFPEIGTEILVAARSEKAVDFALKMAEKLRKSGKNVENFFGVAKPEKVLKHARKKNVQWLAILGEREVESGEVVLENLQTGAKKNVVNFLTTDRSLH